MMAMAMATLLARETNGFKSTKILPGPGLIRRGGA
jgi:hypothetical protein